MNVKKKSNKLLNYIKKNKLLSILILIFVVIFILFLVVLKVFIFPSYSVDKYGDRLDGIDSVLLNDSRFNEVKSSFEAPDGFEIDKFDLSGKIVNIYISVVSDFDVNSAKELSTKLVNSFNEDELGYYDFQVFVTSDSDSYPIIGYKNKISEGLYWNYEGGI